MRIPLKRLVCVGASFATALACASPPERAAGLPGGQHVYEFEAANAAQLNPEFLLYLPDDAARAKEKAPLLLFLHGAGERGGNIAAIKKHGPPKLLENGGSLPFVVVSPQLPQGAAWSSASLIALLDYVASIVPVDAHRVYLTGLSLGGHGTWRLAADYPERFAAVIPIAGRGDPERACALRAVPVWAFHGARDDIVAAAGSIDMVDAIRDCGGEPKLTIYDGIGHDSWTRTYESSDIYDWLLEHRR